MARKKYDWGNIADGLKDQGQTKKDFGGSGDDIPKYKPVRKNGKFKGIIRFLPPKDTALPIVNYSQHFFQGKTGKYVVEPCKWGIAKEPCPICKDNKKFWDEDSDYHNPKIGRQRKGSKDFYANILVVRDSTNPSNEGKVFFYRFPETIYKKIMQKVAPPAEEADFIKPVMVFDYDEGADFILDIAEKKDPNSNQAWPTYEGSYFAEAGPISLNGKPLTDDEIDEVEGARVALSEYVHENITYKSDDEIAALLKEADGDAAPAPKPKPKPEPKEDPTPKAADDLDEMFGDSDSSADTSSSDEDDDFFDDLD